MEMAADEKCPRPTKLRAWNLAHKILKETFLDRTLGKVKTVEFRQALDALPVPADEKNAAAPVSSDEAERREMLELLRGILQGMTTAQATQAQNGNGRPGLFLLRDPDRAAG